MNKEHYNTPEVKAFLNQGLVVSCQPVDGGALDESYIVAAMAKAAIDGGAIAVRIEGADNVAATRKRIDAPIIGIVKRIDPLYPIIITPTLKDVQQLAQAGADVIAIDGTERKRPESREKLIHAIHQYGCSVMADCSNRDDGDACHQMGADIIGTTLSGYTGGEIPIAPDFELLQYYIAQGYFTMAEGRYDSPALVVQAIALGANAVTVGTVLTRLEVMTRRFVDAMAQV